MRVAILIVIGNLFLGFFLSSGQTMTIETNTLNSAAYALNQGWAVYGEGYSGVNARGIGGNGLFCDGIFAMVSGANAYSGYFIGFPLVWALIIVTHSTPFTLERQESTTEMVPMLLPEVPGQMDPAALSSIFSGMLIRTWCCRKYRL